MKKTEGGVLAARAAANVGSRYATRAKLAPFDGSSNTPTFHIWISRHGEITKQVVYYPPERGPREAPGWPFAHL